MYFVCTFHVKFKVINNALKSMIVIFYRLTGSFVFLSCLARINTYSLSLLSLKLMSTRGYVAGICMFLDGKGAEILINFFSYR